MRKAAPTSPRVVAGALVLKTAQLTPPSDAWSTMAIATAVAVGPVLSWCDGMTLSCSCCKTGPCHHVVVQVPRMVPTPSFFSLCEQGLEHLASVLIQL